MGKNRHHFCFHINTQNIVAGKIRQEHIAAFVELNAVCCATLGKRYKHLRLAIGFHYANGAVTFKVYHIKVTLLVERWSFYVVGKDVHSGKVFRLMKLLQVLSLDTQHTQTYDGNYSHKVTFQINVI